jgi:CRP-like cAMP-binding protein
MSLIDQQPRSGTVIALTQLVALEIKYDVVLGVQNQYPTLMQAFLRDMSERVRFANAYIGEAIDWCQRIADADYDFVATQVERSQATIIDTTDSHQARANAFLSAFFKMVKNVRRREEALKQQIQQLTIQIDEVKRQQAVQEITHSEFFENLQATAKEMRDKRQSHESNRPDEDEPASR